MGGYKIFSGSAHPELAEKICEIMEHPLGGVKLNQFSDGEIGVQINESVRGQDVFILQPTCAPANDTLMELLLMVDALHRSSARSITVVIPYFGYARQDRKAAPRVPISAKMVASLIESRGVDRVITMDLHAGQIQGFFDIPVDNLYGSLIFAEHLKERDLSNAVVVSPDVGGVARARELAKKLDLDLVIVDKRREKANVSEVMNIIGEIDGKDAIFIDDIIDTAGTMTNAARALKARGAKSVIACATHPVLSGPAYIRIDEDGLDELIVTDTIPLKKQSDKITVLSAAPLFAEVLRRITNNESVNGLFGS
ncbi:MAG: ribose-phosphate pyrophosphokinase [Campylobacterales bacterium]|nr:ribose-phosphate pyrophosphokinase [Campylobacterales bacterium]